MKPLPRGRHGLPREFVTEHQRERLLAATAESLDANGFNHTTVSAIASTAGVSKSDFYRHFGGKDECFFAAYDAAVEEVRADVLTACAPRGEWAEGVCAGISAVLAALVASPARANLLLVEGLRAGPGIHGRYCGAIESFVPYIRVGAPVGSGGRSPVATDEAVVGGIASMLGRRVLAGETPQLARIFPEVAEFALAPYLDVAEARRIISSR